MGSLRNLWNRIPEEWKSRIIRWGVSFIFGLLIIWIWDIGTLLVILFILFFVFYLVFNLFGGWETRAISQWSITQFFSRIRGMLLFALLPTAWELIKNPSLESIIGICFLVIIALTIWERFDQMMKNFFQNAFGTRNRRRRH